MKKLPPGAAGWVALGVVVVAAELLDTKTLSTAFRDASRHPVYGPVVIASWAILTAHLHGWIPEKYDPILMFWKHVALKKAVEISGSGTELD